MAGRTTTPFRGRRSCIQFVTDLASTPAAILVLLVVIVVEMIRAPNRWVPPFLITVLVGEVLLVNVVKQLLDRVRPSFNPIAATLGPSFPSGHSATAAALYASVALVLARKRSPRTRALLAGGAAGIAVGVATSRVMLDVHWLSDVIAGLAFGWAWFSICAVAFGGRFLNFGAPLKKAEQVAEALPPSIDDPALDESGSSRRRARAAVGQAARRGRDARRALTDRAGSFGPAEPAAQTS